MTALSLHSPKLLAAAMGGLLIVSVSAGAMSLALFTDTTAVGANAFTTGTIDLTASPASALLTSSALMPGDSVNGELTIANAGTGDLRYAMTSSSTDADGKHLATQMSLVVKTLGTDCATFDGTTLYTGSLSSAAIGDPTAGADTGDRALSAGTNEHLCFRASLPLATGNTAQGAATTTTFTFSAEQTANN
jgi:hypothetical protein